MLIIIQINVDFILPIYSQTYKRKDILKNLFLDSIIIVQKIQGINKRCIRYNRFHKMSFEFIIYYLTKKLKSIFIASFHIILLLENDVQYQCLKSSLVAQR